MKSKVLIISDFIWSHYRAKLLSEIFKKLPKNLDCFAIYIAENERSRTALGNVDYTIHLYPYKILFKKTFEDVSSFKKIINILNEIIKFKPNVIIIPGWVDLYCWFVLFYAKLFKIKVIVESDVTEFCRKRNPFKELLKRFFLKLCSGGLSKGIKSANYLEKLGMKRCNIFISHFTPDNNFIAERRLEFFNKKEEKKISYGFKRYNMLFVGRFSLEKNIETLIYSFYNIKNLTEKALEWGLILVGDGHQKKHIEELVHKLGLNGSIFFIGGKSWNEVYEFYALADVFVLPSISEPWGIVVNEAMICELPIVISNRAGTTELVKEGENGFTFDPYSIDELTNILLKFINKEVNLKLMGKKSKEIINNFTPESSAENMLKGILKVLPK